jgi:hypothetical protein
MWNYVFYLAYLGDKNKNERNGIETYITEKMKNQDNSWFPIGQALGLLGEEFDSKRFQTEEIMKLQTGVKAILILLAEQHPNRCLSAHGNS